MTRKIALWALCLTLLLPLSALADSYQVSVGYADGLRGAGFFPNPWQGDSGVTFDGISGANIDDAGAIMIHNTSGAAFTVNNVTVNVSGNIFSLWGSHVVNAGDYLILTETAYYNFDTSDFNNQGCGVNNGDIPTVAVTVDGITTSFNDTGQVLNTSGYDFACQGNESFQWRPIGGAGGPAGTPEPSTLILMGTGGLGLLGSLKKRFAN